MRPRQLKYALIGIIILLLGAVGFAVWFVYDYYTHRDAPQEVEQEEIEEPTTQRDFKAGESVEGRAIKVFVLGEDDRERSVLVVGGIHGGYEWNSVLLAYDLLDHFSANMTDIPDTVQLAIMPNANPDGVYSVIGIEGDFELANVPVGIDTTSGRFNANGVDLNRNFECKWQAESTWRGETVSAGTSAFSEPEARAIRYAVQQLQPDLVIFLHSQANAVYASECHAGVLPETLTYTNVYATAANYTPVETFDAYEVTGDAEGWLASIGIPAITVEMASHETIEFSQNLAGLKAVFGLFE